MKLKQINSAFFVTIGVSSVVFVYLIFLGYDDIKTAKDIIKIVASVLFPVPMLFFVRFLIIEHFLPQNTDEYKLQNQRPATLLLVITVISVLLMMQAMEFITQKRLEDTLVIAHLINSTTISAYILNYLLYNNLRANGILSGVLLALATHVFFL